MVPGYFGIGPGGAGFEMAACHPLTNGTAGTGICTVAEKDDFSHYNLSGTPPGVGVFR